MWELYYTGKVRGFDSWVFSFIGVRVWFKVIRIGFVLVGISVGSLGRVRVYLCSVFTFCFDT